MTDKARLIAACVTSLVLAASLWAMSRTHTSTTPQQAQGRGQQAAASDPDKALVEQWLRENLDDGQWEEVQWWPAVSLKATYDRKAQVLEHLIAENKRKGMSADGYETALKEHTERGVRRICGIKFRAKNYFGAMAVRNQLFDVGGESPRPIIDDPNWKIAGSHDHDGLQMFGWKYLLITNYNPEEDPETSFYKPPTSVEAILQVREKDRALPLLTPSQ